METVAEFRQKLKDAVTYIKNKVDLVPETGIILGTGLGSLVDGVDMVKTLDYDAIPHFPVSTVETHHGKLLFGHLRGKPVVCMQGRFHYYEGYYFQVIVFPVRVMKALGIHTLVASNAAGGLNPNFVEGDIMLIKDHINFFPGNPLIGPNDDEWGPRWVDMFEAYDKEYLRIAREVAIETKLHMVEGVYCAVPGPCLETAAEYRFFRFTGSDAVGMSTIPEVIAARHQGTRVLAFSIITDMGLPDNLHAVSIQKIIEIAGTAEPKLRDLIAGCVERM